MQVSRWVISNKWAVLLLVPCLWVLQQHGMCGLGAAVALLAIMLG